eukprot:jgi/Tetstr1/444238/TSEL_032131.t1
MVDGQEVVGSPSGDMDGLSATTAFILLNLNRNQPRKRWDLCLKAFADFLSPHPCRQAAVAGGGQKEGRARCCPSAALGSLLALGPSNAVSTAYNSVAGTYVGFGLSYDLDDDTVHYAIVTLSIGVAGDISRWVVHEHHALAGSMTAWRTFLLDKLGMDIDTVSQILIECPDLLQQHPDGTDALGYALRFLEDEAGVLRHRAMLMLRARPSISAPEGISRLRATVAWLVGGLDMPRRVVGRLLVTNPLLLEADLSHSGPSMANYLEEQVGLNAEQMRRIVVRCGRILAPGYEMMVVACLEEEVGLSRPQVTAALTRDPSLVDMQLPSLARKTIQYLKEELGLTDHQIQRMAITSPAFLRLGPAVRGPAEWLSSNLGCSPADLERVLIRSPVVLCHPMARLQRMLDFLLNDMGCSFEDARRIVLAQPHLFSYSTQRNLAPKIAYFKSLGIVHGDAVRIFKECPQVVGASLAAIQAKVSYLAEEWGLSPLELVVYPPFLSYSLEGRIRPRHRYAVHALGAVVPKPKDILVPSDTQFCEQIGRNVRDFRAWWLQQQRQE